MATMTADERREWHARRATGIGASDVPTILGLNPYESPYSLWALKTGRTEPDLSDDNEYQEFGHRAEPMLGRWFSDDTGLSVVAHQHACAHPDHPHHQATLDGLVTESPSSEENDAIGVWECKTTGAAPTDEWWERVDAQVQWQLHVTGLDMAWVTVLAGRSVTHTEMPRDQAYIDQMVAAVEAFWFHVQADEPPPVDDSEHTGRALAQVHPGDSEAPPVDLPDDLVGRAASLKQAIKEMQAELTGVENEIKEMLGDATVGRCPSGQVKWTPITSNRWDTKALEAEHPELADTYKRESSYRRLTVAWEG